MSCLECKVECLVLISRIKCDTVKCCKQTEVTCSKVVTSQEFPVVCDKMLLELSRQHDLVINPLLDLSFLIFKLTFPVLACEIGKGFRDPLVCPNTMEAFRGISMLMGESV